MPAPAFVDVSDDDGVLALAGPRPLGGGFEEGAWLEEDARRGRDGNREDGNGWWQIRKML